MTERSEVPPEQILQPGGGGGEETETTAADRADGVVHRDVSQESEVDVTDYDMLKDADLDKVGARRFFSPTLPLACYIFSSLSFMPFLSLSLIFLSLTINQTFSRFLSLFSVSLSLSLSLSFFLSLPLSIELCTSP